MIPLPQAATVQTARRDAVSLSEQVLFLLARALYRSEVAHSAEMKDALSSDDKFQAYRSIQAKRVIDAARRHDIDVRGRELVDLGCHDGALTVQYAALEPLRVTGVDIDAVAIERARELHTALNVDYRQSSVDGLPLDDEGTDVIFCYDVFEHVSRPADILRECRRVLRPGGTMLIGTWGWYHPFAPHLWSTLAVPWAHVFFSERTMLRVCRRVYQQPWYVPNMHDLDADGRKKADKYCEESISTDYLNKYLIRDFERAFQESGFDHRIELQPFGSKYARWTRMLLPLPYVREFVTGYLWAILSKPNLHSS